MKLSHQFNFQDVVQAQANYKPSASTGPDNRGDGKIRSKTTKKQPVNEDLLIQKMPIFLKQSLKGLPGLNSAIWWLKFENKTTEVPTTCYLSNSQYGWQAWHALFSFWWHEISTRCQFRVFKHDQEFITSLTILALKTYSSLLYCLPFLNSLQKL